jgi:HlyD family secretion protein
MPAGSPPAKRILEKATKRKVPVWYRRGRTFLAGGTIFVLLIVGGYSSWKRFFPSTQAEDITATVKRAVLSITVTERGELESSKTIDARCEVEGYQNKIVSLIPEATKVKGPGWFWWEPGDVVITFDKEKLKTDFLTKDVAYKGAVGKAKAAKGELEVQINKAQGEVADAKLALDLAELDRDKYLGQDSVLVKQLTIMGMLGNRPAHPFASAAHIAFYLRPIAGEYQADVNEKNGDIELAKKDLAEAKEKLDQYRKLLKKGFSTPETVRSMELGLAQKQFNLLKMEAKLGVLQEFQRKRQETELTAKASEAARKLERAKKAGAAAVEKAQSDLDAAEAAARVEKQALDRIGEQLEKCVVRAPADGVVVYDKSRPWDPGSQVRAGGMVHNQQTLFQLPDLYQMQVKVKIHESMIKKVHKGQKAEVSIESLANMTLHGTVDKVGILADTMGFWDERGVKEYVVIVKLDDLPENAGINPGMTAQVKILANEIPDVLLVPVQAVAEKEGKHYAYVSRFGGADRKEVEVGETNEKFVEIKSGLEEGEKVLLDARSRLTAETKASDKQGEEEPKAGEKKKEEKKEEKKEAPAPAAPSPAPAQAAPVAAAPAK